MIQFQFVATAVKAQVDNQCLGFLDIGIGLIEFIETSVFGLINQINESQEDGMVQAQSTILMLLNFAERNPGMTRVLIGDALVNEDERLQLRMNQLAERMEMAFRQSLRLAASQGHFAEEEAQARASLLCSFVMGRWLRFAKTGFKLLPTEQANMHIALLLR